MSCFPIFNCFLDKAYASKPYVYSFYYWLYFSFLCLFMQL